MFDRVKVLRDLQSPTTSLRLAAAKLLEREVCGEWGRQHKKWYGNRETTTPIIAALDDSEPRIVLTALFVLAIMAKRYFKDKRAYPSVIRHLSNPDAQKRMWAVIAAVHILGNDSFEDVLPLAGDRSKKVRHMVFAYIAFQLGQDQLKKRGIIETVLQGQLQAAAVQALGDADWEVRESASSVLSYIGDQSAAAILRAVVSKERIRRVKEFMASAIEVIEGRSRQAPSHDNRESVRSSTNQSLQRTRRPERFGAGPGLSRPPRR
jgi:HEAT repeat protein